LAISITALIDPVPGPSSRRLVWLASNEAEIPVGSAFLRLFDAAGQEHLAELNLNVHPAERRQQVGTRLLEAAVTEARAQGRRSIITQAAAHSPGDEFAAARGFRRVLTLIYSRLALDTADHDALASTAERPHPGYRIEQWTGSVPDALAATFVASRRAMDDMPMGATDFGTVTWNLDGVRAAAQAVAKRGDLLYTVAAIDDRDGTVAGFSELVIPGSGKGDGQHYSTGVLPEHRGHGLGGWMKAVAILQVRRRHPDLAGLLTDTANTNAPMMRINEMLGYRPTYTTYEYQLDL
jgi:GNAT superfamily N-acetyltransferase